MTNLTERLEQHIQKLQEDFSNDINRVKIVINKRVKNNQIGKTEVDIVNALINCCKSGKFIPSPQLEKALVDFAVEDIKTGYSDYEEGINNLLGSDEWGEIITDYIGLNPSDGVSREFMNIWDRGLEYIDDIADSKIYNKVKIRLGIK